MRLGNVIVPNSSYGEIIEEVLTPVLEEMYQDRLTETGKNWGRRLARLWLNTFGMGTRKADWNP